MNKIDKTKEFQTLMKGAEFYSKVLDNARQKMLHTETLVSNVLKDIRVATFDGETFAGSTVTWAFKLNDKEFSGKVDIDDIFGAELPIHKVKEKIRECIEEEILKDLRTLLSTTKIGFTPLQE